MQLFEYLDLQNILPLYYNINHHYHIDYNQYGKLLYKKLNLYK